MLKLLAQTKSVPLYCGLLLSLWLVGCNAATPPPTPTEPLAPQTPLAQIEATITPHPTEPQALPTEEPTPELTEPPSGFDCDGMTDISESECQALVALYNSTAGPNWDNNTNWLSAETPCTWYGVQCTTEGVNSLDLSDNGLTGSIPPELGQLTNLFALDLSSNQLKGSIPPELGQLNIFRLNLARNNLSGSIPPELGQLNLLTLCLSYNNLDGTLPPELGQLTNLSWFDLSNNQFNGSIPPELGQLKNLFELDLAHNNLSGSIPSELGQLTDLSELYLSSNQLSGSIPPEMGQLTSLSELYLSNNQLSGSIPPELGKLTNLRKLDLSNNQLSGAVPTELTQLIYLDQLNLDNNQFSGPIPPSPDKGAPKPLPAPITLAHPGDQLKGVTIASNGPKTEVNHEGWRFSYDTPLAETVHLETMVPITIENGISVRPERLRFTLSNNTRSAPFHQAQIYIYSIEEINALRSKFQYDILYELVSLREVLTNQPTVFDDELSHWPPMGAGPNLESTHIKYLDLPAGSGVRFLNQYLQEDYPVNNQTLLYVFRGLTADGQYYLAATFPIGHRELPKDGTVAFDLTNSDSWLHWQEIADSYLAETVEQLKTLDETAFIPAITRYDELLQTLAFDPTQATSLEGLAQVETVDITFSQTVPLQASVTVRGQLPDGCPISRTRQTNRDDTIQLKVFTTPPAEATCDQAGASFEETVPLDLSRLAVDTYTLEVNQTIVTFDLTVEMLQVANPACPLPTTDQLAYLSPTEGYCLLHPAEVKVDTSYENSLTLDSLPPPEGSGDVVLSIDSEPAQGRTLDQVVAEWIAVNEEGGYLTEQEPITVGGQTGVSLTTDDDRKAYIIHNDLVYYLWINAPLDDNTEKGARANRLWSSVVSSFTFVE